MSVSRQTISRWEADEIIPELNKLVALSGVFSCELDALVKEDMIACDEIYSEVTIKKVKAFKMARYVMITPNPEDDVNAYMDKWAQRSGLLKFQPNAMRIGWDFPFVPFELQIGLVFMDMLRLIFYQRDLKRAVRVWNLLIRKMPIMQ